MALLVLFLTFDPKEEYSTLIASPIPALTSQKQTLGERFKDLAILKYKNPFLSDHMQMSSFRAAQLAG